VASAAGSWQLCNRIRTSGGFPQVADARSISEHLSERRSGCTFSVEEPHGRSAGAGLAGLKVGSAGALGASWYAGVEGDQAAVFGVDVGGGQQVS